ncbi:MAG: hypothetical protein AB7Q29_11060 [Vicinamibacterales bacterium]
MAAPGALRDQTMMVARLVRSLGPFFDAPLVTSTQAQLRLKEALNQRHLRFLDLLRRGVYERPESPYLPLLRRAGITYASVEKLVDQRGLEGALADLYDAGVYVTLDEFKARRPIRRAGLEVSTAGPVFDNPLMTRHYDTETSGSRGPGTRLAVDLETIDLEACYARLFLDDFDLDRRPKVLWRSVPPGAAGLKSVLRMARLGGGFEYWFSQTPTSLRQDPKHAVLLRAIRAAARWNGRTLPRPRHVGVADALTVAKVMAQYCAAGTPGYLSTTSSCAVRVCTAAQQHGLDIRGTFIRGSGEPLSPGKMKAILAAGCVARTHYAMAEVGRFGVACAHPVAVDDVHISSEKVAVLQREGGRDAVPGLWLTTLHGSLPRLMLNVEIGDWGVLERRRCGCIWDTLGYTEHLHTVRSYEKLTSEGMHFIGADLIALIEDVLPGRFGGTATDYQFVEEEDQGLTRVSLIVSPRVGPVSEPAILETVLATLASFNLGHRMMAGIWRQSHTLRVVRREPYATKTGKIHTLHVAP